jgi:hypothetical protein
MEKVASDVMLKITAYLRGLDKMSEQMQSLSQKTFAGKLCAMKLKASSQSLI